MKGAYVKMSLSSENAFYPGCNTSDRNLLTGTTMPRFSNANLLLLLLLLRGGGVPCAACGDEVRPCYGCGCNIYKPDPSAAGDVVF